jgi:hypothetical protein
VIEAEETAFLSNRNANHIPAAEWSMGEGGEGYVSILPVSKHLLIDVDFSSVIKLSSTIPRRSYFAFENLIFDTA